MISFDMCLADTVFKITCVYESTMIFCKDYLCEERDGYEISISEDDIENERKLDRLHSSDRYLETLAVFRKIAETIIDDDVILFHSSVLELDGSAYVFSGPSGIGKTTHTGLWMEIFKDRNIRMINDDKPLIRVGKEIVAYGTPWMGKSRQGENRSAVVKGICFLSQGNKNEIFEMKEEDKLVALLRQTYRNNEKEKLIRTLDLLNQIKNSIPIYELKCTISQEAVQIAYEKLSKL